MKKYILAIILATTASTFASTVHFSKQISDKLQHFKQQQQFNDDAGKFLAPLVAQEEAFNVHNMEAQAHYTALVSSRAAPAELLAFATHCLATAKAQMEHYYGILKGCSIKSHEQPSKSLADCLNLTPPSKVAADHWQAIVKTLGTAHVATPVAHAPAAAHTPAPVAHAPAAAHK